MAFDPLDAQDIASQTSWRTRWVLRLFARQLNADVFSRVLCRAHERQVINSRQLHVLAAQFDPTQRGTVGRLWRPRGKSQ